jgi:FkbM family methyltransferase
MFKKLSFLFFKILLFIDVILKFILNRRFLPFFQEFFHKISYKKIKILDNEIKFFTPNQLTEYRVDTFFTKEPDMLKWIDNFKEIDNLIFWDIGANIGLYSIYNALKNKTSTTISFEPSTSNLRCLSRNISINSLQNKIKVFSLPLTNTENKFFIMNESYFNEGGALNTFGRDYNFEGKTFKPEMKYQLLGTTINYLLDSKILDVPDYIKIDVDGIEHLILEGSNKYLANKKIKSIIVEINENFTEQYKKVLDIMKKNDFKILNKGLNLEASSKRSVKFQKTSNYIFIR